MKCCRARRQFCPRQRRRIGLTGLNAETMDERSLISVPVDQAGDAGGHIDSHLVRADANVELTVIRGLFLAYLKPFR